MIGALRRLLGRGARADAAAAAGPPLRWVVVDVETSGLDPHTDRMLSFGGVAVLGTRIVVADSFECLVRPPASSARDNILVHGIGAAEQLAGADPAAACAQMRDWIGDASLVAYHAAFDQAFVERALRETGLPAPRGGWLDLAALAPALVPGKQRIRTLDGWLAHFGLDVVQRHQAGSDAFATAMLFVRLLAEVRPVDRTPKGLARCIEDARWLGG